MGLHHSKELLNKGNNQNYGDADVEELKLINGCYKRCIIEFASEILSHTNVI